MAVLSTDLKIFLSSTGHGGAITATEASGNNVLGTFSGTDTTDGVVQYNCVYVRNKAAQTAFDVKVYVNSETAHETVNAKIALGNAAKNTTETATTDDETAPAPALTFVDADGAGNALTIGDLNADDYVPVWIEFTVPAGTSAKNTYSVALKVDADTAE